MDVRVAFGEWCVFARAIPVSAAAKINFQTRRAQFTEQGRSVGASAAPGEAMRSIKWILPRRWIRFKNILPERPNDSYAHFQLGYAYAGLKRAEEAKAEFSRAVALDPKLAAALLESGTGADGRRPGSGGGSVSPRRRIAAFRKPAAIPARCCRWNMPENFPRPSNCIAARWRSIPTSTRFISRWAARCSNPRTRPERKRNSETRLRSAPTPRRPAWAWRTPCRIKRSTKPRATRSPNT